MALWGWAKSLAKGANCDSKHASSDKKDTSDGHKHTDDSIKHKTQRSIPGAWDPMEDEDGDEDELRSDQKSEPPTEDNLKTSDSTERHNGLSMPGGWEDEGDNEAESRREGEGDSDSDGADGNTEQHMIRKIKQEYQPPNRDFEPSTQSTESERNEHGQDFHDLTGDDDVGNSTPNLLDEPPIHDPRRTQNESERVDAAPTTGHTSRQLFDRLPAALGGTPRLPIGPVSSDYARPSVEEASEDSSPVQNPFVERSRSTSVASNAYTENAKAAETKSAESKKADRESLHNMQEEGAMLRKTRAERLAAGSSDETSPAVSISSSCKPETRVTPDDSKNQQLIARRSTGHVREQTRTPDEEFEERTTPSRHHIDVNKMSQQLQLSQSQRSNNVATTGIQGTPDERSSVELIGCQSILRDPRVLDISSSNEPLRQNSQWANSKKGNDKDYNDANVLGEPTRMEATGFNVPKYANSNSEDREDETTMEAPTTLGDAHNPDELQVSQQDAHQYAKHAAEQADVVTAKPPMLKGSGQPAAGPSTPDPIEDARKIPSEPVTSGSAPQGPKKSVGKIREVEWYRIHELTGKVA